MATRILGYEQLERRALLSVDLTGSQSVGVWTMTTQKDSDVDVLSGTSGQFTVTSNQPAGTPVTVDWGDGSTPFTGTLSTASNQNTAVTTHTFAPGDYTVTVTAGPDTTSYAYSADTMALGSNGKAESLYVMGNAEPNQVMVKTTSGKLQVAMKTPSEAATTWTVPTSIGGVYGSLLGGDDSVSVQNNVKTPMFFSLGDGADKYSGGAGADTVRGDEGDDSISTGGGNDTVMAGDGNDQVNGADGNDVLDGGGGNDTVDGGNGDDELFGYDGNDTLRGQGGNDLLEGDEGNDKLEAGVGDDLLYGSAGDDSLDGAAGNDWLFGEDGVDQLFGGPDNDVLFGGRGADRLVGQEGNDILAGGYDFLLHLRDRAHLDNILAAWGNQQQVPAELSDPNLQSWNDSAVDDIQDRAGHNLLYWDPNNDRFTGKADQQVTNPTATDNDVATMTYVTSSGVTPAGTPGKTTLILGAYMLSGKQSDLYYIDRQYLYQRDTVDYGANDDSFRVSNLPDSLYQNPDNFWTYYNKPLIDRAVARGDTIIAATPATDATPGSGYLKEIQYLDSQYGYEYKDGYFVPA